MCVFNKWSVLLQWNSIYNQQDDLFFKAYILVSLGKSSPNVHMMCIYAQQLHCMFVSIILCGSTLRNDNGSVFVDSIFVFVTTIIDACIHRLHFPSTLLYIRADAITVTGCIIVNVI